MGYELYYKGFMLTLNIIIIPVAIWIARIDKRQAVLENDIKNIKENWNKIHCIKGGA
jgi:hypothetical protein